MAIFSHIEHRGHEAVLFVSDVAAGLRAVIAIHRTRPTAGGGIRMWPYASEDQALTDVLRLSRAMTYKFALAGIRVGGAKTVVIGDPATDKTEALLEALGRTLNMLGGRYVAGPDVGTTSADMAIIGRTTDYVRGGEGSHNTDVGTSDATAYGVLHGMRAAARHKLDRPSLAGVRVAIQGVGGVGGALCGYLKAEGADLIVADRNQSAAERMAQAFGATVVSPDEILYVDTDILAPCALGAILDDDSIPRLKTAIVCGAANNQLAEDRHGAALRERGILFAPDYVVNAGGTIKAVREGPSYDHDRTYRSIARIEQTCLSIFARADEHAIATNQAADELAEQVLEAERS